MRFQRVLTLLALLGVLLVGAVPALAQAVTTEQVGAYLASIPQGFGALKVADLSTELLENPPFLLDVRQPEEGADGFIPGAVHIPLRDLAKQVGQLPADLDAPIVVYCKSGHRGAVAMTALGMLGYTNVRNLGGGITGWKDAGNPVESTATGTPGEGAALDAGLVAAVDNYLSSVLPQGWGLVKADDLALELVEKPPFLLDVREPVEWDAGYIPGAVHVPLRELAANLDKLPADQTTPIVVYCKGGHRGAIAMATLQMLGYSVRNLQGGYDGWVSAGYEVTGLPEDAPEPAAFDLTAALNQYLQTGLPEGWGMLAVDKFAAELLENPPFLLDVREPSEWDEGHIAGAVHIPLRELTKNLDLLPADLNTPIVIYCKSGHRGALGMVALQVLGYTNVRNLSGGITAWTGAQYEITTEAVEPVRGTPGAFDPAVVSAVESYVTGLPQGWGLLKADDLATELLEKTPFLLDVREVAEWDEVGHLEGAVNIPLRTLVQNANLLPADKNAPIVVYCKGGHRGSIGMAILQMLGYTNVRNVIGGITAWLNAGYPVVGAAAAEPPAPVEVKLPEGTPLGADALQPLVLDYLANLPQGFSSIPADQLKADLGKVFVLDVREVDEFEDGHIAGAVNIPLRDLAKNLHLLPAKDQPIVVYCSVGHRGGIATMALGMLGYERAVSLRSGLNAWKNAGGEVVMESTPAVTPGAFPEVDPDLWATIDAYLTNLPQGFGGVKVDGLNTELLENPPFLLDVREASEFAQGRIGEAVNAPLRALGSFLSQLPAKDAAIVVYDSIGHRGAFGSAALQMLGYSNVRSLLGGVNAWTGAGFTLNP